MMIWLAAAAMVAVTGLVLSRALRNAGAADADGAGGEGLSGRDRAFYRAQLAGIDRDMARGLVAPAEAEALRTEIKRRLLDLDRARGPAATGQSAPATLPLAVIGCLALGGAVALYAGLGAPGRADLPRAERIVRAEVLRAERPTQDEAEAAAQAARPAPPPPDAAFAALMEKLRAAVAARPGDIEGLRLLAENELRLGNFAAAAEAQARLVAALGPAATGQDQAALADARITAAGGVVTAEAEDALNAALQTDPDNLTARFYAGLLEAQTGRPDLAFGLWRPLLDDGPQDAPWVPYLRETLGMVAAAAGVDYTLPEAPATGGPDAADVAAAAAMSEADRSEMIAGMVDGLQARLDSEGGTAAEWAQLVRALGVLGDQSRADAALEKAEAALAADPAGLELVQAAARDAGILP